jgi:phospholipid transport system substrate-binding protein
MTRCWRTWVAAWTLLLLAVVQPALGASDPRELVRDTAERVLDEIADRKAELEAEPQKIYGLVQEIVVPNFDFERISQWVLGKYWRRASEAQREAFVREFRTLLVRTYARVLLSYSGEAIEYLPTPLPPGATDARVRTLVRERGSPPVPIDYSLYLKNGRWLVYDVVVDSVSLVSNYRSSFGRQIQRKGMDQLIALLELRNRDGKS